MKKIVLIVLAVVLVIGAVYVFVRKPQGEPQATATQPVTQSITEEAVPSNRDLQNGQPFRFVHVNRQHPVVRLLMLGFFEACKEYDVDCLDMGIDGVDAAAQITKGEQSISLGSSGVVYGTIPGTYDNAQEIAAAGIPVVVVHEQMLDDRIPDLYAWVAADNVDYAKRSADRMAELINCQGVVAVSQGSYNDVENPVSAEFTRRMNEVCPDVTVLAPQEEGFDPPAAIAKLVAILQANPEVNAAFSTTGAGPSNWSLAAQEMGKQPGDIKIAGMDYTRQNLDFVKSGWVSFLVGQPLYEEAYKAVECLVLQLQGNPCPKANPFPAPLVDVSNMDIYFGFNDRADTLEIK